jgi:hypothetical protein
VLDALEDQKGLDSILRCVMSNPTAKDVATCTVVLVKELVTRRNDRKAHLDM